MKFLVPNYSCLQNPMTKGLPPPDPRPLCHLSSTEFVETPPKKIPGYATVGTPSLVRRYIHTTHSDTSSEHLSDYGSNYSNNPRVEDD